ncbi:MAG TPA: transcriptional regulator [Nitrososphaeraceae archaeon]|nr:transcriptional regulator [Nitrososphaeraceae archaeon]
MSSNENNPKLPAKNKSELTEQVFQAIVDSGETGIFQTELCKSFSIDSRDGSRLVGNLEKQSLIYRERTLYKGRWTYKLIVKKIPQLKADRRPIEITSVEGAPCFSCTFQHLCSTEDETSQYSPAKCSWIEEWVIEDTKKRGLSNQL